MAGITQKSSVAAFPLWFIQKQNGWLKSCQNKMKDIRQISITHWSVNLRWETWNKAAKKKFSVKVDF